MGNNPVTGQPNPQVVIGGAAASINGANPGNYGSINHMPSAGHFCVYATNTTSYIPDTPVPASGQSVTVGNTIFTNTGTTITTAHAANQGGAAYTEIDQVLSIKALVGTVLPVTDALQLIVNNGNTSLGQSQMYYGFFDVEPAVVAPSPPRNRTVGIVYG
ncbi:MAG: hypothetical protein ACRYFS_16190 [Janthinobacterium lividum]